MTGDIGRRCISAAIVVLAVTALQIPASADEGGVSFWVPGQFGSLAAAPQVPGWALAVVNYYTSVSAAGAVAASRQVTIGQTQFDDKFEFECVVERTRRSGFHQPELCVRDSDFRRTACR
jgi:hypothetical protein